MKMFIPVKLKETSNKHQTKTIIKLSLLIITAILFHTQFVNATFLEFGKSHYPHPGDPYFLMGEELTFNTSLTVFSFRNFL